MVVVAGEGLMEIMMVRKNFYSAIISMFCIFCCAHSVICNSHGFLCVTCSGNDMADYGDGSWDNKGRGYGGGGYSRGRGRGFRGRGRGAYGGQPDFQQETNDYDNEGSIPVWGRGKFLSGS